MSFLRRVRTLRLELIVIIAASAVSATVIGGQVLEANSYDRDAARTAAITHVRQTLAEGHLALDEHLSGSRLPWASRTRACCRRWRAWR